MAGFEVADQDPTPLFESSSLCGIFDVWRVRMLAPVYECNMLLHCARARVRVPDGAGRATPVVPGEAPAAQKHQSDLVKLLLLHVAPTKS